MRPDDTRKAASLRSAGDQPRDAARRDQPPRVGGIDQPETYDKAMPSWAWPPGSSEFPSSSSLAVARRTDLGAVLASLPSSDLVVGGARRAHPGLPQGERRRAAGIIAAGGPSISRGGGAHHRSACAPALHGPGCSSSRAAAAVRVVSAACSGWELHRAAELFPIRTGQFISFCGLLHRAGSQVTPPPPARTDGAGFINPDCGPHCQQHKLQGLLWLRPPTARSDSGRSGRRGCDAMRSKEQGIEAIFRAACGRAYSRTWTQRILGRYADD